MTQIVNAAVLDHEAAAAGITGISKTKQKKRMLDLQELGKRLTSVSPAVRKKLALPAILEAGISEYGKINANGAKRRQLQYIGRLMRELDGITLATVKDFFATLDGDNQIYQAYLKRLEQTRTRLINDPAFLTDYIALHPQTDINRLRTLIRQQKKETAADRTPRAYREILRYLKISDPYKITDGEL